MDFEFFMHFYEGPGDFLNDSLIIVDLFLLVFETFLTHSGGLYRTVFGPFWDHFWDDFEPCLSRSRVTLGHLFLGPFFSGNVMPIFSRNNVTKT